MNTLSRACASAGMAIALTLGAASAKAADIVDTAVSAGKFETLVAAVKAAGLVGTLKGSGPFTVFAPTDEAFAALPAGTVENLLKPENKDQLIAILTYHVVPGKVEAEDLAGKQLYATTVQGGKVFASGVSAGATYVSAQSEVNKTKMAKVIGADVQASNGVIHVIDKVLLPK